MPKPIKDGQAPSETKAKAKEICSNCENSGKTCSVCKAGYDA